MRFRALTWNPALYCTGHNPVLYEVTQASVCAPKVGLSSYIYIYFYSFFFACLLGSVLGGFGVEADSSCSFFLWRCTRRSECRRAEEKNGWLWSPRQQCVKIVSFYPPNLSCKKTQKVWRRFPPDFFSLVLSFCSLLLHLSPPRSAEHNPAFMHVSQTYTAWVINSSHCESETPGSRSSYSVSIHTENSRLAYYNRPAWLCSQQPEDGKPLLCALPLSLKNVFPPSLPDYAPSFLTHLCITFQWTCTSFLWSLKAKCFWNSTSTLGSGFLFSADFTQWTRL